LTILWRKTAFPNIYSKHALGRYFCILGKTRFTIPIPHPYYDSQLRQFGYAEFADQAAKLMPQGRLLEAMALVPEEVIDTMTIIGNLDECTARIREYEGITDELILAFTAQR
jgi:hypothetical protein